MPGIASRCSLDVASISVQGTGREINEDSCFVSSSKDLFLIADGMGGIDGGELASTETVAVIARELQTSRPFSSVLDLRYCLSEALEKANASVAEIAHERSLSRMGSTCVVGVRFGEEFHFLGIGDSRAYHVGNRMRQLTQDDTFAEFLVSIGQLSRADLRTSPRRNMLMNYIGGHDFETRSETVVVRPAIGDQFLLCSDGITNKLEDDTIERILRREESANDAAEALVAAAKGAGTQDDLTCIVISVS
jgi:protein phosphatase